MPEQTINTDVRCFAGKLYNVYRIITKDGNNLVTNIGPETYVDTGSICDGCPEYTTTITNGSDCCPNITIPSSLFCTLSGTCSCLNGLIIELIYDSVLQLWRGDDSVICNTFTVNVHIKMFCDNGNWWLKIWCGTDENTAGQDVCLQILQCFTCVPFEANFNGNIELLFCECASGTINASVIE